MASSEFPESDWKLLKKASSVAYERHCAASLREIDSILGKESTGPSEKFDEMASYTKKRSKELKSIFESFNFSRSNAHLILLSLYNWDLLTRKDLAQFTTDTQARIIGVSE